MSQPRFLTRLGITFLGIAVSAVAQLQFEHTAVQHQAALSEEGYTAVFPFTNTGDETVEITGIQSTCGCTVPELDKRIYAPGESGELEAVFTYGARVGQQRKLVRVSTDAGMHELQIAVIIPQRYEIERRLLTWSAEETGEAKAFVIEFHHNTPVTLDEADLLPREFTTEAKWNEDGSRLELRVTPEADLRPGLRRGELRFTDATEHSLSIPIYVRIEG